MYFWDRIVVLFFRYESIVGIGGGIVGDIIIGDIIFYGLGV